MLHIEVHWTKCWRLYLCLWQDESLQTHCLHKGKPKKICFLQFAMSTVLALDLRMTSSLSFISLALWSNIIFHWALHLQPLVSSTVAEIPKSITLESCFFREHFRFLLWATTNTSFIRRRHIDEWWWLSSYEIKQSQSRNSLSYKMPFSSTCLWRNREVSVLEDQHTYKLVKLYTKPLESGIIGQVCVSIRGYGSMGMWVQGGYG